MPTLKPYLEIPASSLTFQSNEFFHSIHFPSKFLPESPSSLFNFPLPGFVITWPDWPSHWPCCGLPLPTYNPSLCCPSFPCLDDLFIGLNTSCGFTSAHSPNFAIKLRPAFPPAFSALVPAVVHTSASLSYPHVLERDSYLGPCCCFSPQCCVPPLPVMTFLSLKICLAPSLPVFTGCQSPCLEDSLLYGCLCYRFCS